MEEGTVNVNMVRIEAEVETEHEVHKVGCWFYEGKLEGFSYNDDEYAGRVQEFLKSIKELIENNEA